MSIVGKANLVARIKQQHQNTCFKQKERLGLTFGTVLQSSFIDADMTVPALKDTKTIFHIYLHNTNAHSEKCVINVKHTCQRRLNCSLAKKIMN